jgi:hypothetical protein
MKSKTFFVLLAMFSILSLIFAQVIYLKLQDKKSVEKRLFVKFIGLPDLAISNETHYVRHRSLSDTFSIFSNSPTLSENFPSTFVYNYSDVQKNLPSRIEIEK